MSGKYSGFKLRNPIIYDKICSILRSSYVLAHSSTRDGLHPISLLERRGKSAVSDSLKNTNHLKPILDSCGHNNIQEWDISEYRWEMRRKSEEIMKNINSEIIVDRNMIMSNINYMEELQ